MVCYTDYKVKNIHNLKHLEISSAFCFNGRMLLNEQSYNFGLTSLLLFNNIKIILYNLYI